MKTGKVRLASYQPLARPCWTLDGPSAACMQRLILGMLSCITLHMHDRRTTSFVGDYKLPVPAKWQSAQQILCSCMRKVICNMRTQACEKASSSCPKPSCCILLVHLCNVILFTGHADGPGLEPYAAYTHQVSLLWLASILQDCRPLRRRETPVCMRNRCGIQCFCDHVP